LIKIIRPVFFKQKVALKLDRIRENYRRGE
jgi:hypothetical protein